jgi:exodeoxyribonuclease VII large subunit
MSEVTDNKKIFSLLEVTLSIQRTLADRYTSSFWVKAEMNKLNHYPHSGHCYPDLVEKRGGKVIAQLKSTIWKDDFIRINHSFLKVVKAPLTDGIKMLFCARITFDPAHGLSLRIIDIDPAFSLGELEREKQETIDQLKKEVLYNLNKTLQLPLVPQRIAIISVETSKGYADFLKVINHNPWAYKFFHLLFPSLLQGERAVDSIIAQLRRIRKVIIHFDVVAIIRGGGGEVGLSCFNNYRLAKEIAQFPIPVITGIGHATNETVVETIAFKNAITPTELADYLLQKFHDFSGPVQKASEKLADKSLRILKEKGQAFHNTTRYFRSVADNILMRNNHIMENNYKALFQQSNLLLLREKESHASLVYAMRSGTLSFCSTRKNGVKELTVLLKKDIASVQRQEKNTLENMERSMRNMSPENVLKRGYSIARINGSALRSYQDVKEGDVIQTELLDGEVTSTVKNANPSREEI